MYLTKFLYKWIIASMPLTVSKIEDHSPTLKAGILKGDIIHFIDHIDMNDFIDDIFTITLKNPTITFSRNGKTRKKKIRKKVDAPFGITYEENLFPPEIECNNKCIFCFVDQLPEGMRKTLNVRDDDWRYSVLYGNYITMTNMTNVDFNRIVSRQVSPLYISVHRGRKWFRSKSSVFESGR